MHYSSSVSSPHHEFNVPSIIFAVNKTIFNPWALLWDPPRCESSRPYLSLYVALAFKSTHSLDILDVQFLCTTVVTIVLFSTTISRNLTIVISSPLQIIVIRRNEEDNSNYVGMMLLDNQKDHRNNLCLDNISLSFNFMAFRTFSLIDSKYLDYRLLLWQGSGTFEFLGALLHGWGLQQ